MKWCTCRDMCLLLSLQRFPKSYTWWQISGLICSCAVNNTFYECYFYEKGCFNNALLYQIYIKEQQLGSLVKNSGIIV